MESFIQGLLLGFGAAVPVGPVNILIMSYSLKRYALGVGVGLGAMSVDIFYMLLMSFGVLKFLNQPIFLNLLSIFGFLFLLYIAYLTYKSADSLIIEDLNLKENSFWSCYTKGVLLNLVNPYIIGFWISVSSFVASSSNALMSLSGLIISIGLWILGLPLVVSKSKRFISQTTAKIFAYASALLMVVFAFILIYNTFFKG
ncbi:LysE family transporter [Campylobacter hyointestinalis]|uniref:LysE family transporter n=1 Tax=Campylobacter hyointestinalis TaxID=198 RepID=UPI001BD2CD41|nr:LysE family transporter [Campylobacter hyointestinalis]MBT0612810.1 LysE family translocator [Campylobacter hyointestinalis subsp. hyointestinalis]MDY2998792.1 LysE family transporter [Campylobacter hyointestinalis]